jgi:quercetin dioxygenase-like cupin family protein
MDDRDVGPGRRPDGSSTVEGMSSSIPPPPTVTSLPALADELLGLAREKSSGRAGRPFHGAPAPDGRGHAPDGILTQIVLALTEGSSLSDHENPGEATLQVLRGRVRMNAASASFELSEGDHLVIPQERHDLVALQDAVIVLTIARHTQAAEPGA